MLNTQVWVLMQNDFPVAVFTNKDVAEAWAAEQLSKGASKYLHIQGPFIVDGANAAHVSKAYA